MVGDDTEALSSATEAANAREAQPARDRRAEDVPAGYGEWNVNLVTGEVVLAPQLLELFGFEDARRLSIEDIRARQHPADRQRIADETTAALDDPSKGFIRGRFRIVREDGSVAWLEARARIDRDSDGRAIGTVGVMLATNGRKATEQPLEQSWRRFETALANTSVVVFQQDLSLRYTWIHDAKLGDEAQSMLGKTDSDLMAPELAGPIEAIKRQVIETGSSAREEVTMEGARARGRYDLYVEPMREATGAIVGITCATIEIVISGADAHSGLGQEKPRRSSRPGLSSSCPPGGSHTCAAWGQDTTPRYAGAAQKTVQFCSHRTGLPVGCRGARRGRRAPY